VAHAKRRGSGRFTAVYQLPNGDERSAGTFDTVEEAEAVARRQEEHIRQGSKGVSPAERATVTIEQYFPSWLAKHPVELSTKLNYSEIYRSYVKARFAKVRVAELQREAVRALLADMRDRGLARSTQKSVRSLLSGMMATAVEDQYRNDNPAAGIRLKRTSRGTKKIMVLTAEQYGALRLELPTKGARLLASTIIETGCRPSEAFALLRDDIELATATIHFTKALQYAGSEGRTVDGVIQNWLVADTKTHDERHLKVTLSLCKALHQWADENGIGPLDPLFPRDLVFPRRRATSVRREKIVLTEELIATLGTHTAPNGREYQHGKWNCYITAKCRCDYCRQAFTDYRYDLEQRKGTKGHGRGETIAEPSLCAYVTSHMWRKRFYEACRAAGLPFVPNAYQLRHTHASWLIKKGEDPKTVMTRLGHTSLRTTAVYVEVIGEGETSAQIIDDLGLDYD